MINNFFKGIITASITPLKDDKIDKKALVSLIERQINAGTKAIVIGGSTGEGTLLREREYFNLIDESVKIADKNLKIIAGFTAASTQNAVEKVRKLNESGVDGLMCTAPYYIKPEQQGLLKHFEDVNKASILPLILYSHPGRTGCDISDESLIKLSKLNNVHSIKDASGDIDKPFRILEKLDADFTMLIGNDNLMLSYLASLGSGCVSVVANIIPKLCNKLYTFIKDDQLRPAQDLMKAIYILVEALELETNPIGVKFAANKIGLCDNELRLPLTRSQKKNMVKIDLALTHAMSLENNV